MPFHVKLQLTNHGVSKKLMSDVLEVAEEFFELPNEDKASFYSEDPKRRCRLYTSIDYDNEKVHFWRDNLRHPCHPVDEHVQCWPEKPARYRYPSACISVYIIGIHTFWSGRKAEFNNSRLTRQTLVEANSWQNTLNVQEYIF